jgi:Fe-S cluster biogenesis protein NfuA
MSDIEVHIEFTPNPDTLKYSTNRTLIASGAANYIEPKAAIGKSPLAEELFKFSEVSAVMIGRSFVTLTVRDQKAVTDLNTQVISTIRSFLESGRTAVIPEAPKSTENLSEIEKKIIEILDRDVRPAVAMDGGDIAFEKYEDGFVYLKMQGSCSGCPSSMMTLKMGVETRLREAIPEIKEVIPV